MISKHCDSGESKQLTPEQLAEVRDCWGMGVPLSILARQRDIDEQELRLQLGLPDAALIGLREVHQMKEKRRQLEALREIFGSNLDG